VVSLNLAHPVYSSLQYIKVAQHCDNRHQGIALSVD